MKRIILNGCSHLRGGIVENATVDETKLEFRNGVAVAEAEVKGVRVTPSWHPFSYTCEGLINENFQEVFEDKLPDSYERNLMFLPYNEKITRFGDNDFVVNMSCYEDGSWWEEYRHIRIINGVPTLVNQVAPCTKKINETLMIMGENKNTLYSIEQSKMLTPYVESIRESETYDGIFDVMAKVKPLDGENHLQLLDFLYFKMNAEGRCVSSVLSSLENDYIYPRSNILVSDLLEERREGLASRAQAFEGMINYFQSNDRVLEGSGYVKKR